MGHVVVCQAQQQQHHNNKKKYLKDTLQSRQMGNITAGAVLFSLSSLVIDENLSRLVVKQN